MKNQSDSEPPTTAEAKAMYQRGVRLFNLGKYDDAEQWWRKAAAAGSADAMYQLGVVLSMHRMAIRSYTWHFESRSQRNPFLPAPIGRDDFDVGGCLYVEGKYAEAAQRWRKAAAAGNGRAMLCLADLLRDLGQSDESNHWWNKAIAAGDPDAMYHAGVDFYKKGPGKYTEAEQWWRKASAAGQAYTLYSLAAVLRKQGKGNEAKEWLGKAEAAGQQQFWGVPGAKRDMWEPRFYFGRGGVHRVPFGWQWNKNLSLSRKWSKKWSFGHEWSKSGGDQDASRWATEMGEQVADLAEEARKNEDLGRH